MDFPAASWPPQDRFEDGRPFALDRDSFEKMKKHGNTLVLFHAPWCQPCAESEPEYHKVSKKMQLEEDNDVVVATLDGNQYVVFFYFISNCISN